MPNLDDTIYLTLPTGRVSIECLPDAAPEHVVRIKELVRAKFFDGLTFHRADDRMVQTGDPTGRGDGTTGRTLRGEFSRAYSHLRGAVSMARMPDDPDSGDCQIFIVRKPQPQFDGLFSLWGRVTEGMELLDGIPNGTETREFTIKGKTLTASGYASDPVRIQTMVVASDLKLQV